MQPPCSVQAEGFSGRKAKLLIQEPMRGWAPAGSVRLSPRSPPCLLQRLIVCLEESLYIHNIRDMKVLHTIRETPPNPAGEHTEEGVLVKTAGGAGVLLRGGSPGLEAG